MSRNSKAALPLSQNPLSAVSRREFLALGSMGVVMASGFGSPARAQTAAAFDFYIGPAGNDGNAGTFSSPWAITSLRAGNGNQTKMSGKRIGLLNGTYDISGWPFTGHQVPLLNVPAGSAGAPTILGAVTPRQAVINGKTSAAVVLGSSPVYQNCPLIGQSGAPGYFTIDGLTLQGSSQSGVFVIGAAGSTQYCTGITVQNCEIRDMSRCYGMSDGATGSDNVVGVNVQYALNTLVTNCYIHDIYTGGGTPGNGSGSHNATGVIIWGSSGTVVQYCTIANAYSGVYDKTNAVDPLPNTNTTVQYCYFKNIAGGSGGTTVFTGFDNAAGSPYTGNVPHHIHHNVVYNAAGSFLTYIFAPDIFDGTHFQCPLYIYNNTVVVNQESDGGFKCEPTANGTLYFYNNILYRTGSTNWVGDLSVVLAWGRGGNSILDYNCYTSTAGSLSLIAANVSKSYNSLSAWQSALTAAGAGANQGESHSINASPSFVSATGGTPASLQLASTSPCINAGRVGGSANGAPCNMGAWDGTASQIGCSFTGATAVIPDPPTNLTVT